MDSTELMRVIQLPILEEKFQALGEEINQKVSDVLAMPCTEETVQDIKKARAELNKLFQELEEGRKSVKNAILEPYNKFDANYKYYASSIIKDADLTLKSRIEDVENTIKQQAEDELQEYFSELCVAYHVEWLQYKQLDIKIDMASAKSKNRTRIRKDLRDKVEEVSEWVALISGMDYELEILAEYKQSLDFPSSVCIVKERHERIEQAKKEQEARSQQVQVEQEAIQKVDAIAPPTVAEEIITITTTLRGTKSQLIKFREFCDKEGIVYE